MDKSPADKSSMDKIPTLKFSNGQKPHDFCRIFQLFTYHNKKTLTSKNKLKYIISIFEIKHVLLATREARVFCTISHTL